MTADLTVCQLQHTIQDQNALFLFRQTDKGFRHQLVPDMQSVAVYREQDAVAWVFVHHAELVHFILGQGAEFGFPVPLASQIPQIGSGLVAENSFAKSIKPAAFSITISDVFHFPTPDLRESEEPGPVVLPPVAMLLRQLRPAPKDRWKRQNSPDRS